MSAAADAALLFEEEGMLGALPQTPQSSGGSSVVPMDTSSPAGSTVHGGSEDALVACAQADAAEREAKKRKLDERLCCVCEVMQALPKFTFCRDCKKDVQSCQNQAKKEERMAEWQRLTKTPEGLRHLILHYKAVSPAKGQGMKRASMDWAQYLERVYSLKQTRLGVKEVYMDSRLLVSAAFRFSLSKLRVNCCRKLQILVGVKSVCASQDWIAYEEWAKKNKSHTSQQAMQQWQKWEAENHDHDFKGRQDYEKRFAVEVEEYQIRESVKGRAEDRQKTKGNGLG